MSYEKRNLRVFLSSSMVEFRAERIAIKRELDSLKIPNYVFEKEGASGQAPGEIFRSAVREASVYIGVFGKVCGNYTREEYEVARAQKIACHLYVQNLKDEQRRDELKVFLQSLSGVSDVPNIYYFDDTNELVTQIKEDLWSWADKLIGEKHCDRDRIDIRDNLPVLCDREDQDKVFGGYVQTYFETSPRRHLLLILPGVYKEGHEYYVWRTEWKLLKDFLSVRLNSTSRDAGQDVQSGKKKVLKLKVIKLEHGLGISDSFKDIREGIARKISVPVTEDDRFLTTYITAEQLHACLIVVKISAKNCKGDYEKPVRLLSEYLAQIPPIPPRTLFGGLVCLCDDRDQGWWKGMLRHIGRTSTMTQWPSEHSTEEFRKQLSKESRVQIEFLPRLDSPTVIHALEWKNKDEVREWIRNFSPKSPLKDDELEEIFKPKGSLPMRPLYDKLLDLLVKRGTG